MSVEFDAVVVGAGPNGLAAAARLADVGASVLVIEGADTVGGGCRTAELTVPGFHHDVCSAIHPLGRASPFLSTLPLADHGLRWVDPPLPLAHPLDDGTAAVLDRSLEATASALGDDGESWSRLLAPFVRSWDALARTLLAPLSIATHPALLLRFGALAALPATRTAAWRLRGPRARALFAGLAAHAIKPLDRPLTTAYGLLLGAAAHAVGWPLAEGGSQRIADALAAHVRTLGGRVETGRWVRSFDQLPAASVYLFDTSPSVLEGIAGERFPARYRRTLREFRHGPGTFKVDLALDGPVPWTADDCGRAGTVHCGGTLEAIAAAEGAVARGEHPERPFVLVAQQSLFDATRVPDGRHTVWAYCHVPAGSTVDMTERILLQIERFAPGFRDRILAVHTMGPADLERYNPSYVGGDIAGGAHDGLHVVTGPSLSPRPYATPDPAIVLCSASTPPGPGVHGMCGYHAAGVALERLGGGAGLSAGRP